MQKLVLYDIVCVHLRIILNYQQFLEIWTNLFDIFETIHKLNPPDSSIGLSYYWKCYNNFTDSKIYGENGEIIGSETCYFILPCDQDGTPINPPVIILKEWREIRRYLPSTPH